MSDEFVMPGSDVAGEAPIDIPSFTAGGDGFSFPEGMYLGAIGAIKAMYPKDSDPRTTPPEAVTSDLWVVKYLGTSDKPDSQLRIVIKDGKCNLTLRGTRIVERYPHPRIKPKMAWRASGFWSHFDCIDEIPAASGGTPEKVVNWMKAKQRYGLLFKFTIKYSAGKKADGTTANYRNIQYDDTLISMSPNHVPADQMKLIEQEYERLKALDKANTEAGTASAPPPEFRIEDDLPF